MTETDWLAGQFEARRPHLRGVAYRMLGSLSEADDAVQDAWIRVSRAETEGVSNLGGWLTTVVARVCLNRLRARRVRREESLETHLPDPIVAPDGLPGPEEEALLADGVGLALQVVLETLAPSERLAFVLHDIFGVPFEEIAPMVGRTPTAARQLASRARRRVKGAEARTPDSDLAAQRRVVDAFFAAARDGDFEGLLAALDPNVVLRIDGGTAFPAASMVLRGASAVARQAAKGLKSWFRRPGTAVRPALVNGAAGVIVFMDDRPVNVMGFVVSAGRIVEIDAISEPERARRIAEGALGA